MAFVSQQVQGATRYGVQFDHRSLFELAGIALVLAFGVGGIVTNDLSGKVFRKSRLLSAPLEARCGVMLSTTQAVLCKLNWATAER